MLRCIDVLYISITQNPFLKNKNYGALLGFLFENIEYLFKTVRIK